ncbi:MAG TPA: spore germination protein, partial [Syntrophomonadaceae bacterium]|nr:spore germination protein [Syntrophomonadaceae bacterium]
MMRYISTTKNSPASIPAADNLENMTLSNHLQDNLDRMRALLQSCSDAVVKEFSFGNPAIRACMFYFDGL